MTVTLDINDAVVTLWCAQHGYPDPEQLKETEGSFLTRMTYDWIVSNTRGIVAVKAREDAKGGVDQAEATAVAAFNALAAATPPPVPIDTKP